jgi:hypothetical protein
MMCAVRTSLRPSISYSHLRRSRIQVDDELCDVAAIVTTPCSGAAFITISPQFPGGV